jgi:hypothetical protein
VARREEGTSAVRCSRPYPELGPWKVLAEATISGGRLNGAGKRFLRARA